MLDGRMSLTSRLLLLLGGPRRTQRRNVAVGAPPGDGRVRVLHRTTRRICVPEGHLPIHPDNY
jgi:hypothetical protein